MTLTGPAGTPFASKFNAGVIGLRSSSLGLRFAQLFDDNIREYIRGGKPLSVFHPDVQLEAGLDQELLYTTYLELKDKLLFESLPVGFNDSQFYQNSTIWHGKGTARHHPLYRVEKARFQYPGLYHPFKLLSLALSFLRALRRRVRHWAQE
jgi:hypothetical protein